MDNLSQNIGKRCEKLRNNGTAKNRKYNRSFIWSFSKVFDDPFYFFPLLFKSRDDLISWVDQDLSGNSN